MMSFLSDTLKEFENQGLRRTLREVDGPQGRKIIVDGKEVLNFCSNNYLGLADDGRLKQAAIESLHKEGLGSGASRLVCGNMNSHRELEKRLAEFKGKESCLVFNAGYMANVGIISSLFGREDMIFCDKLNHASIIDGILLSGAQYKRYPHCDMGVLEDLLKKSSGSKRRLIVSDSVFSMDGDIAPLDKIVSLAQKYEAVVMIDEAHAFGVLGEHGRGAAEHFNLEDKIDIQMGTLSKAAGAFGAYCCGSNDLISYLVNHARSFIYTTGLPPAVCAAAVKSIEIIRQEPQRRKQLWKNTGYLTENLKRLGFNIMNSQTSIIPILIKDPRLAVEFSKQLFKQGIFVSAIRPPTVPQNTARLRVTLMATHTKTDLDFAHEQFQKIGRTLCLI